SAGMLPLPLRLLGMDTQVLEAAVPELVQERAQLGQPLGARPVQAARPLAALGHQPSLAQHLQVLGDRRPGDVGEPLRDRPGGELVAADEPQDLAPAGLRDRLEGSLHAPIVSSYLRKLQLTSANRRAGVSGPAAYRTGMPVTLDERARRLL